MASSNTCRSKYVKAVIIVKDIYLKILTEYIDNPQNPMPPQTLYAMAKRDNSFISKLSRDEMHILPTLLTEGYQGLDFTFLYKLTRYFNLVNTPTRGWGNQPNENELEIGDDIERLRKSRNVIIHKPRAELSMQEEHEFNHLSLEVGKRADCFLRKHPDHGFQKEISDIQINGIDLDIEEKYIKSLEEIVQLKRQCSKTIAGHAVNLYYGSDIQMSFGKDAENHNGVLYIDGLKPNSNKDDVVRILNELKENINNGNYGIVFNSAETGSVLLNVVFLSEVWNSPTDLHRHVYDFMEFIFSHQHLSMMFKETIDVVMFSDDYIDPPDKEQSFIDDCMFNLTLKENTLIKLNVNINKEALENPETFHSVATDFIDRVQRQSGDVLENSIDLVIRSTNHSGSSAGADHDTEEIFEFDKCSKHGSKITYYCSYHDRLACDKCFLETHIGCSGCKSIEKAAKYAKTSAFVLDFEERINETLANINEVVKERLNNLTQMTMAESRVRKKIKDIRKTIDSKLDQLEQKVLADLNKKYSQFDSATRKTIDQLEKERGFILQMKAEVIDKKDRLSGKDVFVGAHRLNDALMHQENKMNEFLQDLVEIDFSFKENKIIDRLILMLDSLGEIETEQKPSSIKLVQRRPRRHGAQLHIPRFSLNNDLELVPHKTFSLVQSRGIYSCVILPTEQYVFVNNSGNSLIICNVNGEIDRTIELLGAPRYIAKMDDSHVAITYDQLKIDIYDLSSDNLERRILISTACNGIHYDNGKFYLLSNQIGIEIIEVTGKMLKSIPIFIDFAKDIVVSDDKIYLTDWEFHTVQCRDIEGKLIWKYNGKELKYPRGLAIDEHNNIYVASGRTNQVLCLSKDGEYIQSILSDTCTEPSGVFYSRELKQLLVTDLYSGKAHLLKVQHGVNTRFFTVL